jgi:hypothetical protein
MHQALSRSLIGELGMALQSVLCSPHPPQPHSCSPTVAACWASSTCVPSAMSASISALAQGPQALAPAPQAHRPTNEDPSAAVSAKCYLDRPAWMLLNGLIKFAWT